MRKMLTNNKGFSLIELMVVVAIIGVLSAIGIPQYSKFQAKSRQSEAKSALAALFTAEASFMAEWNQYTKNLQSIGFGVAGNRLRYVTGFNPAAACVGYSVAGGAPAEALAATNAWSDGALVNVGGVATFAHVPTAAARIALAGTTSSCVATAGLQAFVGIAVGDPNANVGNVPYDGWTINQVKLLANSTPGIR